MEDSKQVSVQALEGISQRRQEISKDVSRPLPPYIRTIEVSEVLITIDPDILPYKQVDPSKLVDLMKQFYSLTFTPPSVDANARRLGVNLQVEPLALLDFLLKTSGSQIRFDDGRYPTGPNAFVPINSLIFSSEKILANVAGPSSVAETLISDAFEILWQASGVTKRWESDDVKQEVQLKSYGTKTKVNFGYNIGGILSGEFTKYLESNLTKGEGFAPAMMSLSLYDNFEPRSDVSASWFMDKMELEVRLYDLGTGRAEESRITINVSARDEYGRGVADVTSELPFEKHARLVRGLVEACRPNQSH